MRVLSVLFTLLLLTACGDKPAPEPVKQEVFVVTVEEQPYHPSRAYNGRIRSKSDVDIMAQVSGELIAIHFKEGDRITAGSPLYNIDPAPYKAQLSQAKAELARATANEANARKNFERGKKLVTDGFISQSEFDTLEARALEAEAAIKSAEAAVESAQVNLDFTTIKAPQDGRVGRSKPAIGDVVGPQTGALTTLVGEGGKDVIFQLPEKLLLALRNAERQISVNDVVVALELPDGSKYPETGRIDYFSNRVDATTGTIETMAHLPDPDDILRPGMFVKVTLKLEQPLMGLMIPQAALQVDQQGTYVLGVDDSDTITRKNLIVGERFGENTLVNSGLEAGTRIVIRGVQQVRVGDTVIATPFEPATKAAEGDTSDQ